MALSYVLVYFIFLPIEGVGFGFRVFCLWRFLLNMMSHALNMELFLCSITWLIIRSIAKHFKLFSHLVNSVHLIIVLPFCMHLSWALVSTLDPFRAFHLGFLHLHLCVHIPLALRWEVQLFF